MSYATSHSAQSVHGDDMQRHRRLLGVLDEIGSVSFDALTLSQCTVIARSIGALRPTDRAFQKCVHLLLEIASVRVSEAVLLGTEGAAAAADTACAVLHMVAQHPSLVDQRAAKGALQQAGVVIRHSVDFLAPQDLASALCVPCSLRACAVCA